ncbi:MAG: response regulator transcription factor [Gammaproteobacteria bacterium]|nr:response regulator transcription factor [Gammaproteobacteria bacterium]
MPSLLLVEDDTRVQRFLVPGLEVEGYTVAVAANATEGYTRAMEEPFDALVFDVMLPDFSGRELCRRLRSANITTPLLMLTALDATEDKVEGLRDGADDYMTKPFDFDELLARIEALIRRSNSGHTERASKLQVGDVVLDRAAFTVCKNGEPIEFTTKEFQVLQLLMSSPDRVISRTRILNKVWGYDSDPLTNVVDVNIQRIRAKLQWRSGTGPIKTVRGYGYKLTLEA